MIRLCLPWARCMLTNLWLQWFNDCKYCINCWWIQNHDGLLSVPGKLTWERGQSVMRKGLETKLPENGDRKHPSVWCCTRLRCSQACDEPYLETNCAQFLQQRQANRHHDYIWMISSEGPFISTETVTVVILYREYFDLAATSRKVFARPCRENSCIMTTSRIIYMALSKMHQGQKHKEKTLLCPTWRG